MFECLSCGSLQFDVSYYCPSCGSDEGFVSENFPHSFSEFDSFDFDHHLSEDF